MDDSPMSRRPTAEEFAGVRQHLGRAGAGDEGPKAVPAEARPPGPEAWGRCSDLAAIAERAWVALAAGPDRVLADSLHSRMAGLRAELSGPDPTPLERLAIDRVVITWLQAGYGDVAAAGAVDVPMRVASFALERQDRAQKRHLAALAGLGAIRRLLRQGRPQAPRGAPRRRGGEVGAAARGGGSEEPRPPTPPSLSIVSAEDPTV